MMNRDEIDHAELRDQSLNNDITDEPTLKQHSSYAEGYTSYVTGEARLFDYGPDLAVYWREGVTSAYRNGIDTAFYSQGWSDASRHQRPRYDVYINGIL